MSGLYGFLKSPEIRPVSSLIFKRMGRLICLGEHHRPLPGFEDDVITSGVIPVNEHYRNGRYASQDGIHVWFEGEISNLQTRGKTAEGKSSPAMLLQGIFSRDESQTELAELCGYFSAVVYNTNTNQIHFVSDRFGLRHLFVYFRPDRLFWCSQQKGFLAIPGFDHRLKLSSVQKFLEYNYLPGDYTWFENVNLVPPASTITVDLNSGNLTTRRYWNWRTVCPDNTISDDELIDRMHEAFYRSIERMINQGGRIVIPLSGGLDSRLLLAAANKITGDAHPWDCFTFGEPDCDDIAIARQVATVKPFRHRVIHYSPNHIFQQSEASVWRSDCAFDISVGWHCNELFDYIKNNQFTASLNGFLGDAIYGGSYLPEVKQSLFEQVEQRGRKYIAAASKLALATGVEQRKPFVSKDVVDLIVGVDHRRFANSSLYKAMLLRYYPDFFMKIPWQKTLTPISHPQAETPRKPTPIFRCYEWATRPENNEYIHQQINNPQAKVRSYVNLNRDIVVQRDPLSLVLSLNTLEVWLKKIDCEHARLR